MKKLIWIISLGFLLISAAMIYLLKTGISLHMATLIKPSVAEADLKNVAQAVVFRMYPEFQSAHYVLWGTLPVAEDEERLFAAIKAEYERIFHLNVQLITEASSASAEDLRGCGKPCWIFTTKENANELTKNEFIEGKLRPLAAPYFNITLIPFVLGVKAPSHCLNEKRLTYECLTTLAMEASERKVKTKERYFFLKKYNDRDFFLFVQESKKTPDR